VSGAHPPLSLFDRLIDEEPDNPHDSDRSEEAVLEQIKLGLRRDLEGLLNAKRPYRRWLGRHDEVAKSVVGFGLPDLSTEDFGTAAVRERIRRLIAQTIRSYEPRLRNVEVEADGAPRSTGIRFRISAVLAIETWREPVNYDARLRPSDRDFAVSLAR